MDINCSLNCQHQKDGKCSLNHTKTQKAYIAFEEPACPYYEKTVRASSSTH